MLSLSKHCAGGLWMFIGEAWRIGLCAPCFDRLSMTSRESFRTSD